MARISKVNGQPRATFIVINGEKLNFTFDRSKYTPQYEETFQKALRGDSPGRALAKMMVDVLVSWDLEDDTQDPIGWEDAAKALPCQWPVAPLTVDSVYKMCSTDLLRQMAEAMSRLQGPNDDGGQPSADTFEPMVD
jgi:hypothetical protein